RLAPNRNNQWPSRLQMLITLISAVGPALGPLLAAATGSYTAMALSAVILAAFSLSLARFS
ncbi:hypothetical protein, partial [uncultured Microbacterium sp.]|uniref:hypothetical protein n=1 Tax=uncultured Microbacterium sp. TaxID=191216 RepID=UPI002605556C